MLVLVLSNRANGYSVTGAFGPSGPSDAEARQVIAQNLSSYSNVVITHKDQCQLSANTQAEGTSQRWIITFDYDDTTFAKHETNSRVTIAQVNGKWVWSNAAAYCGE